MWADLLLGKAPPVSLQGQRRVNYLLKSEDPDYKRSVQKAYYERNKDRLRKQAAEKERARYHSDPEYRARKQAAARKWDAEHREQRIVSERARQAKHYLLMSQDPEWVKRRIEYQRQYRQQPCACGCGQPKGAKVVTTSTLAR